MKDSTMTRVLWKKRRIEMQRETDQTRASLAWFPMRIWDHKLQRAAACSPLHLEELPERRRGAAVLQVAPEAERQQQRPDLAALARRPRAPAPPATALHGVHQADQARQRHPAAGAAASTAGQ